MDLFKWSRQKSVLVSAILVVLLSLPCVFGYNIWSGFQPLGKGKSILDLEDFIVSNNLLPLGSLAFVLFCTKKNGWGWNGFIREADFGRGVKFPSKLRPYFTYILPVLVIIIYVKGYWDMFSGQGIKVLTFWMILAAIFLIFIFWCALGRPKKTGITK